MNKFVFGTFVYQYNLLRQDRKTLSLTVMPDLRIVLKCPQKASDERIENFLKKKWFWLEKQLSYFKKYQRKTYKREYISGESYLYLGRQYKLAVVHGAEDTVSFSKGKITIYTTRKVGDSKHNKKLLNVWYEEKTQKVFMERFDLKQGLFDYKKMPKLIVREMQKRWGSFLNKDKIFLNPKLIQASKDCIDYVIVHELCHMKYKSHNKKFFDLLENKYPKWERVKEKLEYYNIV